MRKKIIITINKQDAKILLELCDHIVRIETKSKYYLTSLRIREELRRRRMQGYQDPLQPPHTKNKTWEKTEIKIHRTQPPSK